jgi:hypothetical protein
MQPAPACLKAIQIEIEKNHMGIETYPVVQGQNEGALFLRAEWKWLTDCIEELDTTAEALGLVALSKFYSYSRRDAIDSLGEDEVEEMERDAEFQDGWFVQGETKLWSLEQQCSSQMRLYGQHKAFDNMCRPILKLWMRVRDSLTF